METQFVEFTSRVGSWEPGTIESMPRSVAEGYVAAGQAKPSDALAHMRASLQADSNKQFAALEERLLGALKPQQQRKDPPGSGSGVDFNHLEGEGRLDPAKLKPMDRYYHAGQMVRALLCAQASDTPPAEREWGRNLLHNLYCGKNARVDYRVVDGNDQEGAQRFNENVGVTRTGTESISGGPSYGFLVKPEWSDVLYRLPIEESVIEPYAFEIPVGQALEFKIPALDQYITPTAGQSAAYAGFILGRKGEISSRTLSDGKTKEIDYKITDLTAFTAYSRDLDADAFIRIGSLIQQVLGQAFQWKKDYEFINGNGAGMPMGFLGGPGGTLPASVLTQNRGTGSHIEYEDIVKMMQQMHPALWREMYWITNSATTLVELESIKNHAGNLVFQPNSLLGQWMTPSIMGEGNAFNNMVFRAQGMLQGKPIFFSEKVPALGTKGDLCLVNPRYAYGVATRAGLEMGMSEHFYFDTDRIAVRWKLRNDARPLMSGPYIQSDGGNTTASKVSWAVVLN